MTLCNLKKAQKRIKLELSLLFHVLTRFPEVSVQYSLQNWKLYVT